MIDPIAPSSHDHYPVGPSPIPAANMVRFSDILIIIIMVIFPPVGVLFETGCSCDLLINIGLTVLGYLPGLIHAGYILIRRIEAEEMFGRGGYIYVGNAQFEPVHFASGQVSAQPPHYGSTH
ncbi:hypothetical protein FRC08_009200 [Ceratobasidium sp. 394]|nr:hypothetical protein FRC08_009200 [Ceratobasidium sp. 394]